MGFADDWKTAKNNFEGSTKAKKPSDTFLGVFKKGSGIESALKDADKAKTAGDLKKAIAAFKSASATYTATLDKAINDPKAVASDAKKAYAEASKVLKDALGRILASAETTAESLAGADKKAAVDPAVVRAQADALKAVKAHVALRQKVFLDLQKFTSDFGKRITGIEEQIDKAKQQLANAKSSKSKGETMQASIAAGAVVRFVEEAVKRHTEMKNDWSQFAKQGGELMKAREDNSNAYNNLAPEHAHYRAESNQLFGAGDKLQQALQLRMKNVSSSVEEARAMAEESEQYQLVGAGPKVYETRAKEILQRADALNKNLKVRLEKADGWERLGPKLKDKDQKGKEQTIGLVRTVLVKHAEDVKEISVLDGRLKKFPESALDDRSVQTVVADATKIINEFNTDARTVTQKGMALIKELGG